MWLKTLVPALLLATITGADSGHHGHQHHYERATHSSKYEYVVIGSGPGGGPLAARLALAGHKVLLIEAGPDHNGYNETVPARNLQATEDPAIAFSYFCTHYKDQERQARDPKMTYRKKDGSFHVGKNPPAGAEPLGILYPRTGALGGCAQHNAAVTVYPFESDWTHIQTITGDDTWAPENMRNYFKKLEDCQYAGAGAGHGTGGWFHTSLTELGLVVTDLRVVSIVVSAASALGKSDLLSTILDTVTGLASLLVTDLNAEYPGRDQVEDLFQIPQAINRDTSKRSTPRDFILEVANAKKSDGSRKYHLDIKLNTLATKIHFDKSGKKPRAIGVEYLSGKYLYSASPLSSKSHHGTKGYVSASKEIIVSGGTFQTPQLLKLSGIGPKKELKKHGIEVIKDLPGVGKNMQDRYEISIVGQTDDGSKLDISKACTFGYDGKDGDNDPCLKKWKTGTTALGRGPYGTGGVAVGVTMKSSLASEEEEPDLFIFGAPGQFAGYFPGFAYNATHPGNIWSRLTLKAHSHNNAGTVTLRSKDPRDMPQIDFNSLDSGNTANGGNDVDLQALYEGLSFGRDAFDKLIPLDGGFVEIKPGRDEVDGEEALKQYATDETWGHHACCTAPIGADGDEMAVLDSKFRVRGVKGLRVVDATVFPKIPGTFISVPIYQVSEKAADDIINKR